MRRNSPKVEASLTALNSLLFMVSMAASMAASSNSNQQQPTVSEKLLFGILALSPLLFSLLQGAGGANPMALPKFY